MAVMRLASFAGGAAYLEVDAVASADGEGLVVSSVTFANDTAKPMTFNIRRGTGVSILTRTVNAGRAQTTLNVPGSVANRTLVHLTAGWGG